MFETCYDCGDGDDVTEVKLKYDTFEPTVCYVCDDCDVPAASEMFRIL